VFGPVSCLPGRGSLSSVASGDILASRSVTDQRGDSPAPHPIFDTQSDEPFTVVYIGVVLVEAVVLAGLWFFSSYFGA
jgi:hypothetical protein